MFAVKQEGNLLPTITQESLFEDLKMMFLAAGYSTIYAEFDDGDYKNVVYEVVNDSTKTFGTVYLHIQVDYYLEIKQRLHTRFDKLNNEGSNNGDYESRGFGEETVIRWISLDNGSEFKLVMLYQSFTWICLGFIRPQNMPPYWNENETPYSLVSSVNQPLEYFHLSEVNPYEDDEYSPENEERIKSTIYTNITPRARNPFTNDVDIIAGFPFVPESGRGMFGMSSPVIGFATDTTLAIGDSVVTADATYCVIAPPIGTNTPRIVVRTA
jgi:hypothetical protein